ncbi:exonuclease SbcC [Azoarcus sp. CIB]|uniref:AAA family ATPase n=1 Tax=Aromatoleum sp. (strain CIB) TaxID=198107 RepID=UPI00067C11BB|nr:AAA family ATPase [Azoarcus sp. CIB]AKU11327.1 exonuclease SbcC [Azoarcus sp. CIB]
MRILAIRGHNLASLAGAFAIDFQSDPLASAGLFAICGPTGAGKSTLLDALCLALFDNTPRMRGADSRGIKLPDVGEETTQPSDPRNLLRRGCAEGFAEVDFRGNDGIDYRSRWSVRRARTKADGKLQQSSMTLLQLPEERPLGGNKTEVLDLIQQRIGLSFEQFTRAVLLAQNEFFTFLKASEDERGTLLQTLTGRDRFEVLSRRAYERHKREQELLERLRGLLALQQPLAADERTAKEAERATAETTLLAHAERKGLLERQLRWHQDLRDVATREDAARTTWQQAVTARDNALPRQRQLERVEAVQAARPLHEDIGRQEAALQKLNEETATARGAADTALTQEQAAETAMEAAKQHREALRAIAQAFKPRLDAARELDAALVTLAADHTAATQALTDAENAHATARRDQTSTESALGAARGQLTQAQAWLADHARLRTLAEGWPRWDSLLGNAETARSDLLTATTALQKARSEQEALKANAKAAHAAHEATAKIHQERTATLEFASRAADRFDSTALSRRSERLTRQHERLLEGRARLDALDAVQRDHASLNDQHGKLTETIAKTTTRHDALERELPALATALAEIEASWKVVFEASQESIEALRAQLRPDAPCPVCGSQEHPLRHGASRPRQRARRPDPAARGRPD